MSDSPEVPTQPPPWYRSPFVIAFFIGVAVLTVLPLLQRRFLSAPEPLATLPAWNLVTLGEDDVGSARLAGRVWLATFAPSPCDAACVERQRVFGTGLSHVDDLGGKVALVTFVFPGAEAPLRGLVSPGAGWYLASGTREQLAPLVAALREAWGRWAGTDAGTTMDEFSRLPAVLLVDQQLALRGFWRDDAAGRGNAINAARLLAKHGPRP